MSAKSSHIMFKLSCSEANGKGKHGKAVGGSPVSDEVLVSSRAHEE